MVRYCLFGEPFSGSGIANFSLHGRICTSWIYIHWKLRRAKKKKMSWKCTSMQSFEMLLNVKLSRDTPSPCIHHSISMKTTKMLPFFSRLLIPQNSKRKKVTGSRGEIPNPNATDIYVCVYKFNIILLIRELDSNINLNSIWKLLYTRVPYFSHTHTETRTRENPQKHNRKENMAKSSRKLGKSFEHTTSDASCVIDNDDVVIHRLKGSSFVQ